MKRSIAHNHDQCTFDFEALSSQPVELLNNISTEHQTSTQIKQCFTCKKYKNATSNFFVRNKRYPDGLNYRCKECDSAYRKVDHTKEEPLEGMKKCTKCKKVLAANSEFFYSDKSKPDGFNPVCRKCTRVRGKAYDDAHAKEKQQYYQEHREEISERQKQFRKNHQEKLSHKQHVYRATHKEHMRKRDRGKYERRREAIHEQSKLYRRENCERIREHKSAYYKTDHGRMISRASRHRREARERATPGTLTSAQIQTKLRLQRFRCYYAGCGHAKLQRVKGQYVFHLEHTIPISRTEYNPRHDVNHVVLSCPTCNLRKHDKLPHEFSEGGRLL